MTLEQGLITGLLLALMAVFATDRFRIELVALLGLAAGVVAGVVPMARAFSGLANPAVVTVVEILLIVQALQASHLLDRLADWLQRKLATPFRMTAVLCAIGAGVSTVMNNIGAFGLMLPVAYSLSRKAGLPVRQVMMPLSFATLLGGLCTLVGTPANLLIGEALHSATGTGFAFLDFAPTGLAVTAVGLAAMALWMPRALGIGGTEEEVEAAGRRRLVTEVRLPAGSPEVRAGEIAARVDGEVHGALRDGRRVFPLSSTTALVAGRPADRRSGRADARRRAGVRPPGLGARRAGERAARGCGDAGQHARRLADRNGRGP